MEQVSSDSSIKMELWSPLIVVSLMVALSKRRMQQDKLKLETKLSMDAAEKWLISKISRKKSIKNTKKIWSKMMELSFSIPVTTSIGFQESNITKDAKMTQFTFSVFSQVLTQQPKKFSLDKLTLTVPDLKRISLSPVLELTIAKFCSLINGDQTSAKKKPSLWLKNAWELCFSETKKLMIWFKSQLLPTLMVLLLELHTRSTLLSTWKLWTLIIMNSSDQWESDTEINKFNKLFKKI